MASEPGGEVLVLLVDEDVEDGGKSVFAGGEVRLGGIVVLVVEVVDVVELVFGSTGGVVIGGLLGGEVVQEEPNSVTRFVKDTSTVRVTGTVIVEVLPRYQIFRKAEKCDMREYIPGSEMVVVWISVAHVVIFPVVVGTHVVIREVDVSPGRVVVVNVCVVDKLVDVDTSVRVAVGVDMHDVAIPLPNTTKS